MRTRDLAAVCVLLSSAALQLASAEQPQPATDATSALTCVQNALGGTAAFAAVSSLHFESEEKPTADQGLRPIPGTLDISVVFPDKYRRVNRPLSPDDAGFTSVVGFDKSVILSSPRFPDQKRTERIAHQDFVIQVLMRLPRKLDGVQLVQRVVNDSGRERLVIEVPFTAGFRASLLVNRSTCVPVALENERPGEGATRVDLSGYRLVSGIRFPTVLKKVRDGRPFAEEHVTKIEVNSPAAAKAFSASR